MQRIRSIVQTRPGRSTAIAEAIQRLAQSEQRMQRAGSMAIRPREAGWIESGRRG